jgi:hypothetical protein
MRKAIMILWVGIFIFMACNPLTSVPGAGTQTIIQTPTTSDIPNYMQTLVGDYIHTPDPTNTPQPALNEHSWHPEPVLVYYGYTSGMGGPLYPRAPGFVLYSDGRLFTSRYDENIKRERIYVKQLDRTGICQILNTIDQVGYLDYDPQDYLKASPNGISDAGDYYLDVNAWKSISGNYYALYDFLLFRFFTVKENNGDLQNSNVVVSSALANVYYLLEEFPQSDFQVYFPDKFLLWVSSRPDIQFDGSGKQWTLEYPTLAELHAQTGFSTYLPDTNTEYVVLDDKNARMVFDLLEESYAWDGDIVFENGLAYEVFARPLLPYEIPKMRVSDFTASDAPESTFELHCYPTDGTLPIPTPSYP